MDSLANKRAIHTRRVHMCVGTEFPEFSGVSGFTCVSGNISKRLYVCVSVSMYHFYLGYHAHAWINSTQQPLHTKTMYMCVCVCPEEVRYCFSKTDTRLGRHG